jgi:hypothetical protein
MNAEVRAARRRRIPALGKHIHIIQFRRMAGEANAGI